MPRPTPYPIIFSVLTTAVVGYTLLQSLILPVLPTLQRSLHTSQNTVTWVLTSYLLSASIATPILGRVGDMIGKKKVLVCALVVLAVGSIIAAVATSIGVMIIARTVQGAGGAVLPLSFGIVRDEAPKHKVASGISIIAGMSAVGGAAGVVLAGPILSVLDFHWLFWIPGLLVALTAVAAFFFVPESTNRAPGHIAVLPALLLSGWLVALILAVSEGELWGWASARVVGLVALAIVLGVLWVRVELRVPQPLIDMRMMRLPAVWTTNLIALLYGAGLYAGFTFLPEFLQAQPRDGYGFAASVTVSGLYLLPMTVTMFIFGLVSSRMAARLGSKRVLIMGSAFTVLPYGILAFAHHQRWEIYLASTILGVGLGIGFAALSNRIVEAVPAEQVGVASGMNANIRTIGGAIGSAVAAAIITSGVKAGGVPKDSGYRNGFAFLMLAAVMATFACLIIPKERRREEDVLIGAHVVEHGESALVAGATLVDGESSSS